MLEDSGTTLEAAQRKLVAENLFNLAASPDVSDKTLLQMREQEIKLAMLEHDKVKIAQAERKLEQAQELIEMQKAKIAEMKAEAERQRIAAEEAMLKATKDGGMTDETVKIIRRAMGMKVDEEPANP